MGERLSCCVPFCTHTYHNRPGYVEWICRDHWKQVSKKAKAFRRKALAAHAVVDAECESIGDEGYQYAKIHGGIHEEIMKRFSEAFARRKKAQARMQRSWERCKRQAIEAAAGIR